MQNHDLEEQMCQRDTGPNNHGESKRAPTSKGGTKKDQKAVMGRANKSDKTPAVHLSQIWHHRIWLQMQMMKERMDFMMNALKGQVLNDLVKLVHWTDSPFTAPATSFPLPIKFCMP